MMNNLALNSRDHKNCTGFTYALYWDESSAYKNLITFELHNEEYGNVYAYAEENSDGEFSIGYFESPVSLPQADKEEFESWFYRNEKDIINVFSMFQALS